LAHLTCGFKGKGPLECLPKAFAKPVALCPAARQSGPHPAQGKSPPHDTRPMTSDPLKAIVARMAHGEPAALLQFLATAGPVLYAIIARILANAEQAEAALTDTCLTLWQEAPHFAASGLSPMAWAVSTARRHAIDRRDAQSTTPPTAAAVLADLSPEPALPRHAPPLARHLARLDPDRADAVARALFHGEGYASLAARFGLPPDGVRGWLRPAFAP
jgi:RNA polymerase sigma-70 factor, ECF subfamily